MPRIISEELHKKLRREYRLRFFSLLFFALFLGTVLNVLFASSSYLLLSLYERAYVTDASSKQNEDMLVLKEEVNTKVTQLHSLAQKVPVDTQSADIEIFNILLQHANENIKINAIEILPEASVFKVTLRGEAVTRDSLIQFQNSIKQDSSFEGFSIPIESLAQQKNISFNVNLIYHEN